MERPVHFGIALPQFGAPWSLAEEVAAACDELGFDSVWVADHLVGIPRPEEPVFEAWTEVSALAARTRRVRLGFLVLCVSFRSPALLAKMAATLDVISGGRLILGMGAGWHGLEYEAYGYDFPSIGTRLGQLEEALVICRRLWTEDRVSFTGKHFRVSDAACRPAPVQKPHPPLLVGGGGEKVLLRIVARHADIWNNLGVNLSEVEKKREILARHCRAAGRDPDEIEISQQTLGAIALDRREAEARAESVLSELPFLSGGPDLVIAGTPDECIRRVRANRARGITGLLMSFGRRPDPEHLRIFAREVIPAFR